MTDACQPPPASYPTRAGSRFPPGATVTSKGVNFCVYSRYATRVELLLYRDADDAEPFQVIALDPERNRSFFFCHVLVEGLPPLTGYTWRADGPLDTARTGHRFDPRKELLDPWAHAVSDSRWDRRQRGGPAGLGPRVDACDRDGRGAAGGAGGGAASARRSWKLPIYTSFQRVILKKIMLTILLLMLTKNTK